MVTAVLETFRSGFSFPPSQAWRDMLDPCRPVWFVEELACTQGEASEPGRALCLRALIK